MSLFDSNPLKMKSPYIQGISIGDLPSATFFFQGGHKFDSFLTRDGLFFSPLPNTRSIIHQIHCPAVSSVTGVQLSAPYQLIVSRGCCVLWSAPRPVRYPALVSCLFWDRGRREKNKEEKKKWKKNVSLPASSCFAPIGIQGTQAPPECLLHVPRRNVGTRWTREKTGRWWNNTPPSYVLHI